MNIYFRADGNSQIGLGHIVRSLALAHMLRQDFALHFLIQEPVPTVLEQLKAVCPDYTILPQTANYEQEATNLIQSIIGPSDIVVLDGYNFTTEYQEILKQQNIKLVCLDDIHAFTFVADVVINQAGNISAEQYQVKPATKLCLGPAYALLRKPFLEAAQQSRSVKQINRVFINMGGADPQNVTLEVLRTVHQQAPALEKIIVTGGAYLYLPELKHFASENPDIQLFQNVDAEQMCRLMQQCDAAILPPSSVAYEWCSVSGLLFLQLTAENQADMAAFLQQENLAYHVADLNYILNQPKLPTIITAQIERQRVYFHGQSPGNLQKIFLELYFQNTLKLRHVNSEDMLLLYNWANDPEVRENSFNTSAIPLEVHKLWFENKIKDASCFFLIAEVQDKPAGMIRYDLKDNQGIISYLLDKNFRGKGLGNLLLQKGEELIKQAHPEIKKLIGHVQEWNKASSISFQKSGYHLNAAIKPIKAGAVVFEKPLI